MPLQHSKDGFKEHYFKTILPSITDLFETSSLHDVTIVCQDGFVPSFQLLLASCSPMLKEALRDQADELPKILIPDLRKEDVTIFHRSILGGNAALRDVCTIFRVLGVEDDAQSFFADVSRSPSRPTSNSLESSGDSNQIYWKITNNIKPRFECEICLKEYSNEQSFLKHRKSHSQQEISIENKENDERSSSEIQPKNADLASVKKEEVLDRPRRRLSRPKRYHDMLPVDDDVANSEFHCTSCPEIFDGPDEKEQHMRQHIRQSRSPSRRKRSGKYRFLCDKCKRTFSSKQALQNHQLLHTDTREFKCDLCSKSFVTAGTLITHKRLHEGTMRTFPCEYCEKQCNNASNLMRHIRAVHFEFSDGRKFRCQECGKEFRDPSGLSTHRKIHLGIRNYGCEICGKKFLAVAQLRVHKKIHEGIRAFECKDCSKRFVTNGHLKSHVLHRHVGVKMAKSHLCTECGLSFVKAYDLKVHTLKHTGELPYNCDQCGRGFRSKRHLNDHARSHTGEKPFKCQTCRKTFRAPGGLRKHFKVRDACRQNAPDGAYSIKRQDISSHAYEDNVQPGIVFVHNGETLSLVESEVPVDKEIMLCVSEDLVLVQDEGSEEKTTTIVLQASEN